MADFDYTGRVFDSRYKVIRKLAQGGMGTVYLGEHALVGRKVAVKVLHKQFGADEEMVARFYREARAAAAIGHRNIIEVLDVGATPEGDPYLVMEFLEGESLAALLSRRIRLDFGTAAEILGPVLRALQATHEAGIVHRDLKPDNVFLSYPKDGPPEVKLIDFGISKMAEAGARGQLTLSGVMIGTPAYMAPEQAVGDAALDHRADVYAVGVMLYEMVTGKRPFTGDSHAALIAAILTTDPQRPSMLVEGLFAEAERIILCAMRRVPDERYGSAREMLADIEALVDVITGTGSLRELASSVMNTTHAAGDLGELESLEPSEPVAPQMLARMVVESTPKTWSPKSETVARGRRSWIPLLVAVAILLAAAVVILALVGRDEKTEAMALASPPPAPTFVTITVDGAPAGARVYFDGALVRENPFRARRAASVVPLRVEAEGFEPYAVAVEPSSDRTVKVALSPAVAEKPAPAAPGAELPLPTPVQPAHGKESGKKILKATRGAEFAESFE